MTSVKRFRGTFDCARPERLAEFWCEVLGYDVPPAAAGQGSWSAAVDPSGAGPRLFFQRVPEGKEGKNRGHLDVRAAPGLPSEERMAVFESECARLVALGATRVERIESDEVNLGIIVMQDPEGNEFCLD